MRTILLILFSLLFVGCAQKSPITWEARIIHHQNQPVKLAYDEYGTEHDQTILFLHGFGESKHTWRFLVKDLSKKYHLVMLDFKGFGESPKIDDDAYSVYDQAKYVQQFIEEKNLHHLTVVGRSFGGGVSLVMALMQKDRLMEPRIDKIVLINSMAYKQQLPSMMRYLQQPIIGYVGIHLLSSIWIANEAYHYAFSDDSLIPPESVDYAAKVMQQPLAKYTYKKTVDVIIPDDILEMQRRYREIRLPILILWGREDVSIPVRFAHRLHHELFNSQLIIYPHVGHMPQEEIPQKVVQGIDDFMEGERIEHPFPKRILQEKRH